MSEAHKAAALTVIERSEQRAMSPVVSAGLEILRASPSPETLRELLAVQREWEAGEARKAYAVALVALKRDLPTVIARDKVVDFTSARGRTFYRHASLAAVMDAVTSSLTQHGFSLTWHPTTAGQAVSVTCRLTHQAGHHEETTLSAPIDNSGNKSPAQGVASTITLLQRYTALSLLGIATADHVEATGEQEPDEPAAPRVDSQRNLRAVGWLKGQGKSREQAEAHIGRKVAEWTDADLRALKTWAQPRGVVGEDVDPPLPEDAA